MNLWFLTAGVFLLGGIVVALRGRSLRMQSVARTLAEAVGVFLIYISITGVLVAFNLFQLGRMDPLFATTGWDVFRTLYWPSWVLTFAPLLIGGVLVVVVGGVRQPRRLMALVVLLLVTFAALETVFLFDVGVLGTVLVQLALFVLFAAGVCQASRSVRRKGPGASDQSGHAA